MPEGPEAHTVANILNDKLTGYYLTEIYIFPGAKYTGLDLAPLPCKVLNVQAYGKRPIITTDRGYFSVFLAMTGSLTWEAGTHPRIKLVFYSKCQLISRLYIPSDDQLNLYFNDVRPFGRVSYLPDVNSLKLHFANYGRDLITEPATLVEFREIITRAPSNKELCQFLLDPKWICSIGNYLKSEILYLAALRPDRKLGTLSTGEIGELHLSIKEILSRSLSQGGLTISDFKHPDGGDGHYSPLVYMRSLDPYGRPVIIQTFTDKRTSHWVPSAQR